MDEQACHGIPPQQNAPFAIKYKLSNVFHTTPLLFHAPRRSFFHLSNVEVILVVEMKTSGILICPLNGETYGEIIGWLLLCVTETRCLRVKSDKIFGQL